MSERRQSDGGGLLFSFWDGGRGHITRVLALAAEAHKRGREVGFISSEKYAAELASLAMSAAVYTIPNRPPSPKPLRADFPVYSHALRHAQRLQALGYDDARWLQQTTEREIAAIKDFRPAAVINDYRDTIRTAAEVVGVPIIGITQSTGNVHGHTLGDWVEPPEDFALPDCLVSFNEVRDSFGLDAITDERYMFSGAVNIIPSISEIDPLCEDAGDSHYVGMISQWSRTADRFTPIDSALASPRVFSYVGESSRPAYGYEPMLTRVIQSERSMGFYVVGDPASYAAPHLGIRRREGTVRVAPFIPGPEATKDSSVVLTHGGHSTMALSLALGKPLVGVGPFTSEAAANIRNVAAAGAGLYVPHSAGTLERRPSNHEGAAWEVLGHWRSELTSDQIGEALRTIVDDDRFTERASQLGGKLLSLGGVERAVDILLAHTA